jgi:hypothetical protein
MPMSMVKADIAQDMLRDCLNGSDEGAVIPGTHFRKELRNEGLWMVDAWHVLKTGCIFNPPEHDIKTGEWKYTIEGHTSEGIWLAIVFCFKQVNRAFLITVFSVEVKRRPV